MLNNDKIALIYFSRSAEQEAENKKWASRSTKGQRRAISNFLTKRAENALSKSGLEVLCFDETNQQGLSFGEKLANSFETAFSQGFTAAIAVGNDCLDLHQVDFANITGHLRKGDGVMGPTYRKGAYLIGMTHAHFNKGLFQILGWQSNDLQEDLLGYFSGQCITVEILATRRDANTLLDLRTILQSLDLSANLLKHLKNFIAFLVEFTRPLTNLSIIRLSITSLALRGPPGSL